MEREGFEPSKHNAAELQAAPFGHLGTSPSEAIITRMHSKVQLFLQRLHSNADLCNLLNMADTQEKSVDTPSEPVQQEIPATVSAEEIAALRAQAAELASLRAKAGDEKKAAKEAAAKAAKLAEEQGELSKALEHYKAQAAEAEALRAVKAEHDALIATLTADLDKEVDGLPDAVKAAYSQQSTLQGKKALLAAVRAVSAIAPPPGSSQKATPPVVGGVPSATGVDFAAALKDPVRWAEVKARDPAGAASFVQKALGLKAPRTSLGN